MEGFILGAVGTGEDSGPTLKFTPGCRRHRWLCENGVSRDANSQRKCSYPMPREQVGMHLFETMTS